MTATGKPICNPELPLEITLTTDFKQRLLIIQDSGIGMTRDEMIGNLGRIGYSGSLDFMKNIEKGKEANIIGQFGGTNK